MGYFDSLTNAWFKKKDNGKSVFYPYGKFSSGYILSENSELKIKVFLQRYNIISIPIIIFFVIFFGLYAFVLLLFLIPFYSIKIKRLLSNAERTQEKMRLKEVIRNMAVSMGVPTSVLMFIGSLLMTVISIFYIFLSNGKLIGILSILFFGLCLLQSIFLIMYSIKFSKDSKER